MAARVCDTVGDLTKRQREVLSLIASGRNNPQIAVALGITRDGVKWHVHEVLLRLNVDTREEAAELWREYHGLPRRLWRTANALGSLRWLPWAFASAGIVVAITLISSWTAERSSPGPQGAEPASYAGQTIRFTVTEYINPDRRHGLSEAQLLQQAHTVTDEWWRFDNAGVPIASRADRHAADGSLLQTTVHGDSHELLYTHDPFDSIDRPCAVQLDDGGWAQGFPAMTPQGLLDLDYKFANSSAAELDQIGHGDEQYLKTFEFVESNDSGPFGVIRDVVDTSTGLLRGEFVYVYSADGMLVLDQSRIFSPVARVDSDTAPFAPLNAESCADAQAQAHG